MLRVWRHLRNAYIVRVERYMKIAIDLMVLFSIQTKQIEMVLELETWNLLSVRLFCHFTRNSYANISTLRR